jgi:hypothetical protein
MRNYMGRFVAGGDNRRLGPSLALAFVTALCLGISSQVWAVSGVISSNATWSGTVNMTGDVVVSSGVLLTIEPGTEVIVAASPDNSLGSFASQSELIISGSLSCGGDGSEVEFHSDATTPAPGDWHGIQYTSDETLGIANTIIRHADYAFSANTDGLAHLLGVTFEDCANRVISIGGAPFSCFVRDCTVDVLDGSGIEIVTSSYGITVMENTVTGSSTATAGIVVNTTGGDVVLADNIVSDFSASPGIWLKNGATVSIGNDVSDCLTGVQVNDGLHYIGDKQEAYNFLHGNGTGLYVICAKPGSCPTTCDLEVYVRNTRINGNTDGAVIAKTDAVDMGVANDQGENQFINNSNKCIRNTSSCGTISARGNEFGTCNTPGCTEGSVDIAQWVPAGGCGGGCGHCDPPDQGAPTMPQHQNALLGNVPNPFNPVTSIQYSIGTPDETMITIYNVAGEQVRSVDLGRRSSGHHVWEWDGHGDRGEALGSGVYFIRLTVGSFSATRKAIMLK